MSGAFPELDAPPVGGRLSELTRQAELSVREHWCRVHRSPVFEGSSIDASAAQSEALVLDALQLHRGARLDEWELRAVLEAIPRASVGGVGLESLRALIPILLAQGSGRSQLTAVGVLLQTLEADRLAQRTAAAGAEETAGVEDRDPEFMGAMIEELLARAEPYHPLQIGDALTGGDPKALFRALCLKGVPNYQLPRFFEALILVALAPEAPGASSLGALGERIRWLTSRVLPLAELEYGAAHVKQLGAPRPLDPPSSPEEWRLLLAVANGPTWKPSDMAPRFWVSTARMLAWFDRIGTEVSHGPPGLGFRQRVGHRWLDRSSEPLTRPRVWIRGHRLRGASHQVLQELSDGSSLAEVAVRAGVSIEKAEDHLAAAYRQATGKSSLADRCISRMVELAGELGRSIADLPSAPDLAALTEGERRVLWLLTGGATRAELVEALGLAPAREQLRRLFSKLHAEEIAIFRDWAIDQIRSGESARAIDLSGFVPQVRLTLDQLDLLQALAEGRGLRQIAREQGIRQNGVRLRVVRLCKNLGISPEAEDRRAQLVAAALKRKLASEADPAER